MRAVTKLLVGVTLLFVPLQRAAAVASTMLHGTAVLYSVAGGARRRRAPAPPAALYSCVELEAHF